MTDDGNSTEDIAEKWAAVKAEAEAQKPTSTIREQWEEKKAEITVEQGEYIPAQPLMVDVRKLSNYFNYRPRPDQASFWEYCHETGITFDDAMKTFLEVEQWQYDKANRQQTLDVTTRFDRS